MLYSARGSVPRAAGVPGQPQPARFSRRPARAEDDLSSADTIGLPRRRRSGGRVQVITLAADREGYTLNCEGFKQLVGTFYGIPAAMTDLVSTRRQFLAYAALGTGAMLAAQPLGAAIRPAAVGNAELFARAEAALRQHA